MPDKPPLSNETNDCSCSDFEAARFHQKIKLERVHRRLLFYEGRVL